MPTTAVNQHRETGAVLYEVGLDLQLKPMAAVRRVVDLGGSDLREAVPAGASPGVARLAGTDSRFSDPATADMKFSDPRAADLTEARLGGERSCGTRRAGAVGLDPDGAMLEERPSGWKSARRRAHWLSVLRGLWKRRRRSARGLPLIGAPAAAAAFARLHR